MSYMWELSEKACSVADEHNSKPIIWLLCMKNAYINIKFSLKHFILWCIGVFIPRLLHPKFYGTNLFLNCFAFL